MGYYVKLYRGWTCVYTSEVFDTKSEAEICAKELEKSARQDPYGGIVTASVCYSQPKAYSRCYVNADEMCIDDSEF